MRRVGVAATEQIGNQQLGVSVDSGPGPNIASTGRRGLDFRQIGPLAVVEGPDFVALDPLGLQSARSSGLLAKLINTLFAAPATTIPHAVTDLGISYNSAKNNIQKLIELHILVLHIEEERPQWFFAPEIIGTMNANEF